MKAFDHNDLILVVVKILAMLYNTDTKPCYVRYKNKYIKMCGEKWQLHLNRFLRSVLVVSGRVAT